MPNTSSSGPDAAAISSPVPLNTVYPVLFAISFSHLLNDTIQALLPSIYPVLKSEYQLTFTQLGLITFTFQLSASLLQPVVGLITDRKQWPFALPVGMSLTGIGLVSLANASSFLLILLSAAMIGSGSAIFHPESSRIAHMAAGRRRGFAQSLFQVGGNAGSAIGPLLAALIIVPHGQRSILSFFAIAFLGVIVLFQVGKWQRRNSHRLFRKSATAATGAHPNPGYPRKTVVIALSVLILLVFSKYIYLSSLTSYYTFYLMDRFGLSDRTAILFLFLLLLSVAVGTMLGGSIGDRYGRKRVIWASILGTAPFSLALPHANLYATAVLSVFIGLILASAFSAIIVYAQELMPGNVGMVAGLFFGLAFGTAGVGSAVLGAVADRTGINWVFHFCAYLPLLGLLTVFLPELNSEKRRKSATS